MQSNWEVIKQITWPTIPCESSWACTKVLGGYGIQAALLSAGMALLPGAKPNPVHMVVNMVVGTLYAPGLLLLPQNTYRPLKQLTIELLALRQQFPYHRISPEEGLKRGSLSALQRAIRDHEQDFWTTTANKLKPETAKTFHYLARKVEQQQLACWLRGGWDLSADTQALSSALAIYNHKEYGSNQTARAEDLLKQVQEFYSCHSDEVEKYLETRAKLIDAAETIYPKDRAGNRPFSARAVFDAGVQLIPTALFAIWSISTLFAKKYTSQEAFSQAFFGTDVLGAQEVCAANRTSALVHNLGWATTGLQWSYSALFNTMHYLKPLALGASILGDFAAGGWKGSAVNLHHYLFAAAASDLQAEASGFHFIPSSLTESIGSGVQYCGLGTTLSASTVGLLALLAPSIIHTIQTLSQDDNKKQSAEVVDMPKAFKIWMPLFSIHIMTNIFGKTIRQLAMAVSQGPRCALLAAWE